MTIISVKKEDKVPILEPEIEDPEIAKNDDLEKARDDVSLPTLENLPKLTYINKIVTVTNDPISRITCVVHGKDAIYQPGFTLEKQAEILSYVKALRRLLFIISACAAIGAILTDVLQLGESKIHPLGMGEDMVKVTGNGDSTDYFGSITQAVVSLMVITLMIISILSLFLSQYLEFNELNFVAVRGFLTFALCSIIGLGSFILRLKIDFAEHMKAWNNAHHILLPILVMVLIPLKDRHRVAARKSDTGSMPAWLVGLEVIALTYSCTMLYLLLISPLRTGLTYDGCNPTDENCFTVLAPSMAFYPGVIALLIYSLKCILVIFTRRTPNDLASHQCNVALLITFLAFGTVVYSVKSHGLYLPCPILYMSSAWLVFICLIFGVEMRVLFGSSRWRKLFKGSAHVEHGTTAEPPMVCTCVRWSKYLYNTLFTHERDTICVAPFQCINSFQIIHCLTMVWLYTFLSDSVSHFTQVDRFILCTCLLVFLYACYSVYRALEEPDVVSRSRLLMNTVMDILCAVALFMLLYRATPDARDSIFGLGARIVLLTQLIYGCLLDFTWMRRNSKTVYRIVQIKTNEESKNNEFMSV